MGLSFLDIATQLQIGLCTASYPIKRSTTTKFTEARWNTWAVNCRSIVKPWTLLQRNMTVYRSCCLYKCFLVNSVQNAAENRINQKANYQIHLQYPPERVVALLATASLWQPTFRALYLFKIVQEAWLICHKAFLLQHLIYICIYIYTFVSL